MKTKKLIRSIIALNLIVGQVASFDAAYANTMIGPANNPNEAPGVDPNEVVVQADDANVPSGSLNEANTLSAPGESKSEADVAGSFATKVVRNTFDPATGKRTKRLIIYYSDQGKRIKQINDAFQADGIALATRTAHKFDPETGIRLTRKRTVFDAAGQRIRQTHDTFHADGATVKTSNDYHYKNGVRTHLYYAARNIAGQVTRKIDSIYHSDGKTIKESHDYRYNEEGKKTHLYSRHYVPVLATWHTFVEIVFNAQEEVSSRKVTRRSGWEDVKLPADWIRTPSASNPNFVFLTAISNSGRLVQTMTANLQTGAVHVFFSKYPYDRYQPTLSPVKDVSPDGKMLIFGDSSFNRRPSNRTYVVNFENKEKYSLQEKLVSISFKNGHALVGTTPEKAIGLEKLYLITPDLVTINEFGRLTGKSEVVIVDKDTPYVMVKGNENGGILSLRVYDASKGTDRMPLVENHTFPSDTSGEFVLVDALTGPDGSRFIAGSARLSHFKESVLIKGQKKTVLNGVVLTRFLGYKDNLAVFSAEVYPGYPLDYGHYVKKRVKVDLRTLTLFN